MSDFSSAVTAMEMAVKAFGLEGQISVEMDSDAQSIILNRTICLEIREGREFGPRQAVVSSIDEDELESILTTDDVVEAVIEAVAQVVAEQAREHLYHIFETVDDGLEDGE
jgi:hypothetical protein